VTAVRVKICGVTTVEDALQAARAGADAIGLNFWPRSKRCVAVEIARAIALALPPLVAPVGVFVNQPREEILPIVARARLAAIQLHGDEAPHDAEGYGIPVWKALRLASPLPLAWLDEWRGVQGFLVDAPGPAYGGTGTTADWDAAREAALRAPILLAGGLTPDNVAAAIRAVRPWGVDVASGVERTPGMKDPEKVALFVRRAREAAAAERTREETT
jgi:phosphoribosylanthranilate isomerase